MMRSLSAFCTALLILATNGFSQSQGNEWMNFRHEAQVSFGASNFLGDLGGTPEIGRDGMRDFDWPSIRPTGQIGYKFTIHPIVSVKGHLTFGMLAGDDKETTNPFRMTRNCHFRSFIFEFGGSVEVYPIKERIPWGHVAGSGTSPDGVMLSPYIVAGVGGMVFNPKAEYQGKWMELQPLGTEGQGLKEGKDFYKRITAFFPVGIGLKYAIDQHWSVGIETSVRFTTTDYVDDVSTQYYWKDEILAAYGEAAAYFSDPSTNPELGWTGVLGTKENPNFLQRGDETDNDSYLFALFSAHYRFNTGGDSRPRVGGAAPPAKFE